MPPDPSKRMGLVSRGLPAFTIIELLVVMAVIGVLAASLLVAGSAMIDTARSRNTRAVLTVVRDAIEEFREEQADKPTLTKHPAYQDRYGYYPPDELEVFTSDGIPHANPPTDTRAIGEAVAVPGPDNGVTYGTMLFHIDGLTWEQAAEEHRDLVAMLMAIEMFSESASAMLDGIPSSYRSLGPLRTDGNPAQYLDRKPLGVGNAPPFVPMEDMQVRYIIDAWGVPISYLAQRDYDDDDPNDTVSTNHADWNMASTEMIRLNGGRPFVFSYGPDGREQLQREIVIPSGATAVPNATLIQDWADDRKIDNPLNDDNVYPDTSLTEKLGKGAP